MAGLLHFSRRSSRGAGRLCRALRIPDAGLEAGVLLSNVSVLQYRYDDSNTGQDLTETS